MVIEPSPSTRPAAHPTHFSSALSKGALPSELLPKFDLPNFPYPRLENAERNGPATFLPEGCVVPRDEDPLFVFAYEIAGERCDGPLGEVAFDWVGDCAFWGEVDVLSVVHDRVVERDVDHVAKLHIPTPVQVTAKNGAGPDFR